jgi:hypothetical protein
MAATTTVTLNGRTIDLATALPLTLGDWKHLKKLGITPQVLRRQDQDTDAEVLAGWVFYVLHKADRAVTQDDIDGLTFGHLARISKVIGDLSNEDGDRPFSGTSTSSPPPTGGASGTSSS